MKRLALFFKWPVFRWWLMITAVLTVSPACPCCGRSACPMGVASAGVMSAAGVGLAEVFVK